ncbi:MAG: hypothetical protein P8Q97_04560, partial [Myxococcota bacterium]|nr:hypothetical protein [Myxococcota bacterium]
MRDLTILNKEIVMEGFDRLSMDPLMRRDRLESWLHSDEKNPYQKRHVVVHTSSSPDKKGN